MKNNKLVFVYMCVGLAVLVGVFLTSIYVVSEDKVHGISATMIVITSIYLLIAGAIINDHE